MKRPVLLAVSAAAFLIAAPALALAAPRDARQEAANRKLVVDFYERVFNRHEVVEGAKVLAEGYRQHNPNVPDGKAPFLAYFVEAFKNNPASRARIERVAADGDLVWLHVHATQGPDDRGEAIVDIFRVEGGRIVEHWDVIQAVPAEAANRNTMF